MKIGIYPDNRTESGQTAQMFRLACLSIIVAKVNHLQFQEGKG